jgi:EmrB/QacA subfamily drug resistance transporter
MTTTSPVPSRHTTNVLLFVVCLAQFMVILDVAIVNVALPSIRGGLHFSTTGLQWVVNAYTLTFAGFLLLGGRAADLLGRRKVFVVGTAAFALTSLLCAASSSSGLLLGARALQGLSGAVISPATLSIITASFPDGAQRNRGLGVWAAMGGLGASSGALLGGILTQSLGWPAIFAVNVPLGALVVLLGLRVIPKRCDARDARATRHFDVAGAVLVTGGLASVTYAIVRTDTLGWLSPGVLVPLAAGAALIAGFWLVESRFARVPLVPLSIFRLRQLLVANLVVVMLYAALFAMWFFLTLYLQQVLHFDALEAGLCFLPMTLSVFGASSVAPRLIARFGLRHVLSAGMLMGATGSLLLSRVSPGASYIAAVLPGGVLSALGMGLSLVAGTILAVQGVPRGQSGLASGLLNTSRLVGGAVGLAVLSTIAAGHTRGEAAHGASGLDALTDGFGLAFAVGAGFCLVGGAVAVIMLRPRPVPESGELPAERPDHEGLEADDAEEERVGEPVTA